VWHDRKAWWQQEQAILAYFIMAGSLQSPEYLRQARESASFYNAWFLDHDDGGVYFNVLANGIPYLVGNERLKGSHSMSGYHSFELAYLAAVYTNLLVRKQPMDFFFKPKPGGFKDNILRVQPDILPAGSVRIGEVWIDDQPYADFDPNALTVKLPSSSKPLKVHVRVVPAQLAFNAFVRMDDGTATVTLSGKLDAAAAGTLESQLQPIVTRRPGRVEILVGDLQYISSAGVRALAFTKEKLGMDADVYVVGAQRQVRSALEQAEFAEEISFAEPAGTAAGDGGSTNGGSTEQPATRGRRRK
jgi:anti-anti-sigma factor